MYTLDITAIILAILGMVGGWVSFFLDRKKHKQEVESLKADNLQKSLDLSTDFVLKFRTLIGEPLENEVKNLRTEVNRLKDAIEKVNDCPSRSTCPVRKQLHRESPRDHKDADLRTDD